MIERAKGSEQSAAGAAGTLGVVTPPWLRRHVRFLVGLDALAAVAATLTSKVLAFGLGSAADLHVRSVHIPYPAFVFLSVPTWLVVLGTSRCYDVGPFGTGKGEARRIISAAAHFLAVLAVAYYILHLQKMGRLFLIAMVPLAAGFTLLGRVAARYQLRMQRTRGHATRRAIVLGSPGTTKPLLDHLAAHPGTGVEAVVVATGAGNGVRAIDKVLDTLSRAEADMVVITGGLAPGELRRLTWQLQGSGVAVMVAPTVAQLAGPQLDIRPVAGLPLLYVDRASLKTGALAAEAAGSNGNGSATGGAGPAPVAG
jgi:FlaA1/EpsC-like NDP-sugar epimerase